VYAPVPSDRIAAFERQRETLPYDSIRLALAEDLEALATFDRELLVNGATPPEDPVRGRSRGYFAPVLQTDVWIRTSRH
jgi:hypothetical protein